MIESMLIDYDISANMFAQPVESAEIARTHLYKYMNVYE